MRTRGPGESPILLFDVSEVLTDHKIDYAVIGAMAASVHGSIRATLDADALISVSLPTLGKLEKALKRSGFQTQLRRGDADDPIPAMLVITDQYQNRVDLLGGLRNLDPEAFSRLLTVPFLHATIRVVGCEDFIAMKCFAGAPQDLADAREAIKIADRPLDLDLLRRITRRFGRDAADHLERLFGEVGSA